jgi:hypothetical protein
VDRRGFIGRAIGAIAGLAGGGAVALGGQRGAIGPVRGEITGAVIAPVCLTVAEINQIRLFMGQQLSGTAALRSIGLNWQAEQRRIAEEEAFRQKVKAKLKKVNQLG